MTGRKADVIQAAYLASEVAQRLVKAGNEVRHHLIIIKVWFYLVCSNSTSIVILDWVPCAYATNESTLDIIQKVAAEGTKQVLYITIYDVILYLDGILDNLLCDFYGFTWYMEDLTFKSVRTILWCSCFC